MRSSLLCISLLLWSAVSSAADYLLPLSGRQEYRVAISARGVDLTGVCIVKTDGEGSRGALVNEFGIHALDFTLTTDRTKVKLLNVTPALDRWYIRKVIRRDFRQLFGATAAGPQKGRRHITIGTDSTVVLTNDRYQLKYEWKKLNETAE